MSEKTDLTVTQDGSCAMPVQSDKTINDSCIATNRSYRCDGTTSISFPIQAMVSTAVKTTTTSTLKKTPSNRSEQSIPGTRNYPYVIENNHNRRKNQSASDDISSYNGIKSNPSTTPATTSNSTHSAISTESYALSNEPVPLSGTKKNPYKSNSRRKHKRYERHKTSPASVNGISSLSYCNAGKSIPSPATVSTATSKSTTRSILSTPSSDLSDQSISGTENYRRRRYARHKTSKPCSISANGNASCNECKNDTKSIKSSSTLSTATSTSNTVSTLSTESSNLSDQPNQISGIKNRRNCRQSRSTDKRRKRHKTRHKKLRHTNPNCSSKIRIKNKNLRGKITPQPKRNSVADTENRVRERRTWPSVQKATKRVGSRIPVTKLVNRKASYLSRSVHLRRPLDVGKHSTVPMSKCDAPPTRVLDRKTWSNANPYSKASPRRKHDQQNWIVKEHQPCCDGISNVSSSTMRAAMAAPAVSKRASTPLSKSMSMKMDPKPVHRKSRRRRKKKRRSRNSASKRELQISVKSDNNGRKPSPNRLSPTRSSNSSKSHSTRSRNSSGRSRSSKRHSSSRRSDSDSPDRSRSKSRKSHNGHGFFGNSNRSSSSSNRSANSKSKSSSPASRASAQHGRFLALPTKRRRKRNRSSNSTSISNSISTGSSSSTSYNDCTDQVRSMQDDSLPTAVSKSGATRGRGFSAKQLLQRSNLMLPKQPRRNKRGSQNSLQLSSISEGRSTRSQRSNASMQYVLFPTNILEQDRNASKSATNVGSTRVQKSNSSLMVDDSSSSRSQSSRRNRSLRSDWTAPTEEDSMSSEQILAAIEEIQGPSRRGSKSVSLRDNLKSLRSLIRSKTTGSLVPKLKPCIRRPKHSKSVRAKPRVNDKSVTIRNDDDDEPSITSERIVEAIEAIQGEGSRRPSTEGGPTGSNPPSKRENATSSSRSQLGPAPVFF